MRKLLVSLTVILLAGGALVVGTGGSQPVGAAELEIFPSCPALLDRLKAEALEQVGPYGLQGGDPVAIPVLERSGEELVELDAAAESAPTSGSDGAAAGAAQRGDDGADYTSETGTNVQVVGVDEPDQVKLSGDTLAMVSNQRLRLLDVSGEMPRPIGKLDLSGELHPQTMLAAGDRLVIFGHPVEVIEDKPQDDAVSDAIGREIMPYPYEQRIAVVVVDVSDPAAPRQTSDVVIDGVFVSARLTEGRVLLVTRSPLAIPFVYPQGGEGSEERAEEANRAAIRESTLEQWLPHATFGDGAERVLADCERVGVPSEILSWQAVGISAFDPADLGGVRAGATFGAGDTVYASRDRVYVAGQQWDEQTQKASTAIHAFTTDAPPAYLASGEVEGQLLNQFSMDRFEGHLRVGSTTQDPTTGGTDSRVTVLAERGEQLVAVGQVTGLGRPGEQIRGIRFLGPVGYVVTFRQTDP
ncbi:MAG: beta-propeller domain-containing protein, partial [Nitriliruptorales bacterium]|nr:beta-propeller domain-containing protein [Nitriliruptorales bacterium]